MVTADLMVTLGDQLSCALKEVNICRESLEGWDSYSMKTWRPDRKPWPMCMEASSEEKEIQLRWMAKQSQRQTDGHDINLHSLAGTQTESGRGSYR